VELEGGVFVSSLSTEEFEADRDVVGTEVHLLCEGVGLEAGLSRALAVRPVEPIVWTLPSREVVLVLEGAARVEIKGGPTLQLNVGDIASIPAGAETTWHLTLPFKEFWVLG
jgi:ethanolamine utilization protein EutQ (cupin superfamily)